MALLSIALLGLFWAQALGPWWFDLTLAPGNWNRWWTMFTSVGLHASIGHVLSNLFSLTVLVWLASYAYPRNMILAVPASVVGAGLAILFLGLPGGGGHLGASGIAYGLMAMFVVQALLRRTRMAGALLMVVAFLFGAAWWGLFPVIPDVSWQGHLGGAVAGAFSTLLFWRRDPISPSERGLRIEDTQDEPEILPPGSPPRAVHPPSGMI